MIFLRITKYFKIIVLLSLVYLNCCSAGQKVRNPAIVAPWKLTSSKSRNTTPGYTLEGGLSLKQEWIVPPGQNISIAAVICGDRLEEGLTMLKSCLLYSGKLPVRLYIFTDNNSTKTVKQRLLQWRHMLNGRMKFNVLKLNFPERYENEWSKIFKPCSTQKIFLPTALPHVDSVIYFDTDTLLLSPIESLWRHFAEFNEVQMAALSPDHPFPEGAPYKRAERRPDYAHPGQGFNTGVMLLNLTRMRAFQWNDYVTGIYHLFRTRINWGDQEIANLIFHYHPETLFILNCDANFRPQLCRDAPDCPAAGRMGARVLHATAGDFHSVREPAFSAVYDAAHGYQLGSEPRKNYLDPLLHNLKSSPASKCGNVPGAFTNIPFKIFGNRKNKVNISDNA